MHRAGSLIFTGCFLLSLPAVARAQPAGASRKQAVALKLPNGSIRIDGRLDEEVWLRAEPITDFTQ